MTSSGLRGTGTGILPAATRGGQRNLLTPGARPEVSPAWSTFAPTAVTLPDGRTVTETSFTRLTGRSPILLAGMTPTTVDAAIVAAAANAGHWAELAGGGQVTEQIFADRVDELPHAARAGPRGAVQLAVPRPLPVEAAARRQAPGAARSRRGRAVRRRRRHRRHPRARGSRRADRGTRRGQHQLRRVQAGHDRADPLGHPHRQRGARPPGHRPHRGRPRGRSPLLGGPRRPAARHLRRAARPAERHRLRRRRHRYAGARGRVPDRHLVARATASRRCRSTASSSARPRWPPSRRPPPPRSSSCSSTPPAHPTGSAPAPPWAAWRRVAASSVPTSTRSTTPPRSAGACSTRSPVTPTPSPRAATRSSRRSTAPAKPYFGDVETMTYTSGCSATSRSAIGGGESDRGRRSRSGSTSPGATASRPCCSAPRRA